MAVLSPHPSIITQNVSELNLHEKIQNSWMSYKVRPILKNQKQIKGQTTNWENICSKPWTSAT